MGFLLVPVLALMGWFIARRDLRLATRLVRWAVILMALVFLTLVITGLASAGHLANEIHRWSGHALVIAAWIFAPFAGGVTLRQNLPERVSRAILQIGMLVTLILASVLAAFTGYLDPPSAEIEEVLAAEARNRFVIMHMVFLPSMVALLLLGWYRSFRPVINSQRELSSEGVHE